MSWVAVSHGALDLRGTVAGERAGDVAVTPIYPGDPVVLRGDAAALWLRLVDGPVDASALSREERKLVEDFTYYGIASTETSHTSRVRSVPAPWLSSELHELVYALVQNAADDAAVDLVFIKGPPLYAQGLRDREHSGDVDVLVAPGNEEKLADVLERWGWSRFRRSALNDSPLVHSVALHAPPWACEVDIHFRFPGIGAVPSVAFDLLANRAEHFEFAGTTTSVPCRSDHATIQALHLLRPLPGRPHAAEQIAATADGLRRAGVEVIGAAHDLGATAALATPLRSAFPDAEIPGADDPLPPDWSWMFAPTVAGAFLDLLKLVPLHKRPGLLFRLVWPPAEYAMAADAFSGGKARNPTMARLSRLARGLQQFASLH